MTGGSGVALGLPENFRRAGLLGKSADKARMVAPAGKPVILAGSCSSQTRRQISHAIANGVEALRIDPVGIEEGRITVDGVVAFVTASSGGLPPLVYSSADPDDVASAQARLGGARAGALVERLLGQTARALADRGYARFVVAGGETSGAVVQALGIKTFEIGSEIDPGVPWVLSRDNEPGVAMALKSGNFGSDDFFLKAWDHLA